ncbi:MAG: hypothetical protein KJ737_21590 [Proteobacteria bacterium]|nr:hypothetical protein [Pseudomonadota bacterium]
MELINTNKKNAPCHTKYSQWETAQEKEKLQLQFPGNAAEQLALAGKLAASFAHSIRNPLTSIKMRLYSLKRIDFPPDQKDDLEVIVEEICNIENLVKDFLEFSRPIQLKTEKISPSNVVDKTIRLLRPDLEGRKVQLHLHRTHCLPEIWIDAEKLKEALVNLVLNGSEANGNGNGYVSIHEKELDLTPFGRSAVIEIHDNGDGIPESAQGKIFQPFFTTKEEGTGMGLNIAKQLVEAQGGKITFYSIKNEGSIFTITFPF